MSLCEGADMAAGSLDAQVPSGLCLRQGLGCCEHAWIRADLPPVLGKVRTSGVTLSLSFLLGVPLCGLGSATIPTAREPFYYY